MRLRRFLIKKNFNKTFLMENIKEEIGKYPIFIGTEKQWLQMIKEFTEEQSSGETK